MARMKGMFKGAKKLFGSPKKKVENKAPVKEIAVDEAGEVHTDEDDGMASPTKPQEPVAVPGSPEVTAVTETTDKDIVSLPEEEIYKDDNDGSEKKCCEACEGCIVM